MPKPAALPPTLPPRLVNREAAAAYVSVSPNTFDELVKTGKMPAPKSLWGKRRAWDVRALDACVDNLPSVGESVADETWSDVDAA